MNYIIFSSVVLGRRQYSPIVYKDNKSFIEDICYLFSSRKEPAIWPVFTGSNLEEILHMEPNLSNLLKGLEVSEEPLKIRYNGRTYEVEEICPCALISDYWQILSNEQKLLLDPNYIEFVFPKD